MAVPVEGTADVLIASHEAELLAVKTGFSALERAELRLAVRELATNLVRHAGGGTIRLAAEGSRLTVEAIDSGPGIPNVELAFADGYTTAGGLGYGLGTVNRVMDDVEVVTRMGKGTTVRARRSKRESKLAVPCPLEVGVATMPKPGYADNGDGYVVRTSGSTLLVGVIDGVGHGTPAHKATLAATRYVETHIDQPLDSLFRGVALACRGTRGVVMALARIDWAASTMEYASVGNIETRAIGTSEPPGFLVRRGILGVNAPEAKVITHPWPATATLIMHSDGVASRWGDESIDGILELSANAAARELLVRFDKQKDDATVLLVKPA